MTKIKAQKVGLSRLIVSLSWRREFNLNTDSQTNVIINKQLVYLGLKFLNFLCDNCAPFLLCNHYLKPIEISQRSSLFLC